MKKRQIITILAAILVAVVAAIIAFSAIGHDTDNSNSNSNSNSDEEIRKKFNCDRVTADVRATDVYCQDPSRYRQDLEQDKVLNPSDAI